MKTLAATVLALTALCIATPIDSAMYQVMMNERVTVTAYSPKEMGCSRTGCITASGKPAEVGDAAISRDLEQRGLRFGDRIHLIGIGDYAVTDRMHEKWTKRVDVFFKDHKKAMLFGKKRAHLIVGKVMQYNDPFHKN